MSKKVKVAIVDSGVSSEMMNKNNIVGGINLKLSNDKKSICFSDDYIDNYGHGTFCTQVINLNSHNVDFFIVKILDDNGYTNSFVLEEALKYLVKTDVDIINLSISINKETNLGIEKVINKLSDKGKYVVASVENGKSSSIPAKYNEVYGVIGAPISEEDFIYDAECEVQFIMSGIPVLCKNHKGEFKFFGGNSKATCLATSLIANIISGSKEISYEKNKSELISRKKYINKNHIHFRKCEFTNLDEYKDFSTYMDFERICTAISNYLKVSKEELVSKRIFDIKENISEEVIIHIFKIIEDIEDIKIDLNNLPLSSCEWIYTIINYVENKGVKVNE